VGHVQEHIVTVIVMLEIVNHVKVFKCAMAGLVAYQTHVHLLEKNAVVDMMMAVEELWIVEPAQEQTVTVIAVAALV